VHPADFGAPPAHALQAALERKYANRVLHDVGLCVCVFDLAHVGEGKVRYGDGLLWYKGMSIAAVRACAHRARSDVPARRVPALHVRSDPGQSQVL
jgi:hypothetical protein